MTKYILAGLFLSASAFSATTGLSPSSVLITAYGIAVSKSTDCSNPTVVANFPSGQQFDFMQNPVLLSGTVAPGIYPCVILKMSDVITYTPAQTSDNGYCTSGTSYTRDVCRSGGLYTPTTFNADNTITFGSSVAGCTGSQTNPVNDMPALFLSTGSTSTNGSNVFIQPTNSLLGFKLSAPFVVTGSGSGTFVVNFNGQVKESGGGCDLGPAAFGFR